MHLYLSPGHRLPFPQWLLALENDTSRSQGKSYTSLYLLSLEIFSYRYFIALFLLIKYILYGKVNITSSYNCQVRSEKPSVSHNQLSRCLIAGETRSYC